MLLSIIVPVYNMAGDGKLNHCLDSLVNQTISDYEIIAVDDASTDNSREILQEYKEKYPDKIKLVFHDENKRQGGAKNTGLSKATGTWVGFIDSDDYVTSDYYEKLLNKAAETGADLVGCDYTIVDHYTFEKGKDVANNSTNQVGILDDEKRISHILRSGSMVVKIYLRQVIVDNELSFPEGIFYEDNCAAPIWAMYFKHFERVEEANYYYLTVSDSTTHHVTWDRCMDRVKAGHELLSQFEKRQMSESLRSAVEYRYIELSYAGTLFSYMYSGKRRRMKNTAYLRNDILKLLPDFQNNPYYEELMKEEDKKFIRIHKKSNFVFFVYYCLLFWYRSLRK